VKCPVRTSRQNGDLGPHPTLGQLGQPRRVLTASDQGGQHQPSRHPGDVGGHTGQLHPGVFQQLLQALDLPAAFPGDHRPRPSQIPQHTDRLGRHERGPHQPMAPRSASHAASETSVFRPGTFHVPGVDQHHLQPVFEQVVKRPPVIAGGFHHHTGDLLGEQMLPQRQDLVGHRPPRRHRRDGPFAAGGLDPDADLGVLLEISIPAHRGCTTSITHRPSFPDRSPP